MTKEATVEVSHLGHFVGHGRSLITRRLDSSISRCLFTLHIPAVFSSSAAVARPQAANNHGNGAPVDVELMISTSRMALVGVTLHAL
jgi:hypothetical protein